MWSSRAGRARVGDRGGCPPPAPGAPLTQSETVAGFWWCHPAGTRCACPPRAQRSQLTEQVPSLPLNLLEDKCWHQGCVSIHPGCVSFGLGAGHPIWESPDPPLVKEQHTALEEAFPCSLFYLQGKI